LGNEACNTRTELSSQIEGVGSLIFPIDLKQGNFFNLRRLPVLIRTVINFNNNLQDSLKKSRKIFLQEKFLAAD